VGAKVRQGPADIIGEGVDVFTPPPLADIITGKKSAGDFKIGELLFGALGVTRGGKGIKAVIRAVRRRGKVFTGRTTKEARDRASSVFGIRQRVDPSELEQGSISRTGEFIPDKQIMGHKFLKKPETFAKKEGAPLSTRLRDEQVVKLLEEHGMGVERLAEGGIRATSKAVGPGGKVTDSVKTFRNPTAKQVRDWLGF